MFNGQFKHYVIGWALIGAIAALLYPDVSSSISKRDAVVKTYAPVSVSDQCKADQERIVEFMAANGIKGTATFKCHA